MYQSVSRITIAAELLVAILSNYAYIIFSRLSVAWIRLNYGRETYA